MFDRLISALSRLLLPAHGACAIDRRGLGRARPAQHRYRAGADTRARGR